MDVISLLPNFRPDKLIEGYSSMIWTERFQEAGDFSIVFADVETGMAKLPLESFISLRDTKEVMIVEDYLITKDEDGLASVAITGRSFFSILENRVVGKDVINPTPNPLTLAYDNPGYATTSIIIDMITDGQLKTFDIYPGVKAYSAGPQPPPQDYQLSIEPQDLYTAVINSAKYFDQGIRSSRPLTAVEDTLDLVIYFSTDRSVDQNVNDPVIFDYSSGHFDKVKYLFSTRDKKNIAYVFSKVASKQATSVSLDAVPNDISGFDRRVLFVDASDISVIPFGTTYSPVLNTRGLTELKKHQGNVIFEGRVSSTIPYKYNVDYNMGDIVTVRAEYGFEENLKVTEYIRTEDATGEHGHPTLSRVVSSPYS